MSPEAAMNKARVIPADTKARQQTAASPRHSAWVSANAGSGKTEVLVQRVIRLLLEGARPSSILCLTFTKAAAAEMMNRVFDRLGQWVNLSDADLKGQVEILTSQVPSPAILQRAKRLFAEALETPGGLKVQTIHAFCEQLLHQFPFDANVPANFSVLDDTESRRLCTIVFQDMITEKAHGTLEDRNSLSILASVISEDALGELSRLALSHAEAFRSIAALANPREEYIIAFRKLSGLQAADTADSIATSFFRSSFWAQDAYALASALQASTSTHDRSSADVLFAAMRDDDARSRLSSLVNYLLTKSGEPKKPQTVMAKATRDKQAAMAAKFDEMMLQAITADTKVRALQAIDRSWVAIAFLEEFIRRFRREKAQRGKLDFADLIAKTRALLYRDDLAPWILYKLDYSLSHILIDEAQDTSPEQWDIIKKLSEEFTVGDSSGADNRTLFAVGDEKQSIYGFQGAAPELFGQIKRLMKERHDHVGRKLADVPLVLSFRSTEEILSAVDQIFSHGTNAPGLIFDGSAAVMPHESLRRGDIGFVELWPQEYGQAQEQVIDPWSDASDHNEGMSAREALSERIAKYVAHLLRYGDPTGRTVRAGDVMILVRQRGPLFDALIQSLKRHQLPVAGADRLKLTSHIAVKDLLALGRACTLPDDDMNLAILLKSPLFGLDDDDLLKFAPKRLGSLYAAFSAHVQAVCEYKQQWQRLERWRSLASTTGPFSFYTRVMEAEGGRRAMLQRLGSEASDAMNEFLQRAYQFELRRHGSLTAFLLEFENADIEIKRDFAHGSDEIRIMTIHAAKGLEAPIVILPDTASPPAPHKESILQVEMPSGQPLPFWSPSTRGEPAFLQAARAREATHIEHEYRRLLYVAMTRAANGLVICAARYGDAKDGSWYQMVSTALRAPPASNLQRHAHLVAMRGFDDQPIERWVVERKDLDATTPEAGVEDYETPVATPVDLPEWLLRPAPARVLPAAPISPSSAETTSGQPGFRDRTKLLEARARGRFTHALLEVLPSLPADDWKTAAQAIARRFDGLGEDARETVIVQVMRLLERPDLRLLFGPDARAEVAMSGQIAMADGTMRPVLGVVDRMVVQQDTVWVADFKSNPFPPRDAANVPETIVAQLALYQAVLADIYPGRTIRCLIVWTAGPAVHELPQAALDAALARVKAM